MNGLPGENDVSEVIAEIQGRIGCITLNRPKALNALSLPMVRALTQALQRWQDDPQVLAVAVRGTGKEGPFGAFCAGGDIRFFHQAAHAGDTALGDFFTEEYALNHLIHTYAKPYIAFMDGIVMGGGMGISQGASVRVVTERTKMAMPETNIGLFPDVGGGWFLARCPGHVGEYLALTGQVIGGADAVYAGLADAVVDSAELPQLWEQMAAGDTAALAAPRSKAQPAPGPLQAARESIDRFFGLPDIPTLIQALEADGGDTFFGEPELEPKDLMRLDPSGRGVILTGAARDAAAASAAITIRRSMSSRPRPNSSRTALTAGGSPPAA